MNLLLDFDIFVFLAATFAHSSPADCPFGEICQQLTSKEVEKIKENQGDGQKLCKHNGRYWLPLDKCLNCDMGWTGKYCNERLDCGM